MAARGVNSGRLPSRLALSPPIGGASQRSDQPDIYLERNHSRFISSRFSLLTFTLLAYILYSSSIPLCGCCIIHPALLHSVSYLRSFTVNYLSVAESRCSSGHHKALNPPWQPAAMKTSSMAVLAATPLSSTRKPSPPLSPPVGNTPEARAPASATAPSAQT